MAEETDDSKPRAGEEAEEKPSGEASPQATATVAAPAMAGIGGLPSFALSIWPPTQRTRDAVIQRLVETLSAPSVLSKRYGALPADEAATAARRIEEEAFAAASSSSAAASAASAASVDEGIEVLQIYSREISRRMLDSVKARAAATAASSASSAPAPSTPSEGEATPPPAAGEEASSHESETSAA